MFKLTFKQQVLIGFAITFLFVFISALSSSLSIRSLNGNISWQAHTYEIIDITRKIDVHIVNSETSLRGYLLTEKEHYLDPYRENSPNIIPAIENLSELLAEDSLQRENLDSLRQFAILKLANMEKVLQNISRKGRDIDREMAEIDLGKHFKDRFAHYSQLIINREFQLLDKRKEDIERSSQQTTVIVVLSAVVIFILVLVLFYYIRRTFDQQKETEAQIRENNNQLETLSAENARRNWILSGLAGINKSLRGEHEIEELSNQIIQTICEYTNAPIGALFLLNEQSGMYELSGSYAYQRKKTRVQFALGEGLVGQVAKEKKFKFLNNIPGNYVQVHSGLGQSDPNSLLFVPIVFQEETLAVIEVGYYSDPEESVFSLFEQAGENIGIAMNSAISRVILQNLYEQTQHQAEELETQQEELRATNEELLLKSEELQASEEELRVQQEELQQTNAELEEKAQLLEEKNVSINQAREAMSLKAEELELSSKYKSEFLANMSHELRTPLNSILILARILKENKTHNLNNDQIKYAGVIQNAGTDLLHLINDILDLSKIESGKIDLEVEKVSLEGIRTDIRALFDEVAANKKVNFDIAFKGVLPENIQTDSSRLQQIIKNLLSNAFKFTSEKGMVTLGIRAATSKDNFHTDQLKNYQGTILAFEVQDTGIGISMEKQKVIFEAFKQADGSTSRKYGGTGLGLSISRELAHLLGGEIQVQSEPQVGSTFTLFIPDILKIEVAQEEALPFVPLAPEVPSATHSSVHFDENKERQTLLIVEDDINFAEILKDYAKEKGFDVLVAYSGDTGLSMAQQHLPQAIILDVMLPVMDGWTILKTLKSSPLTKHIPVHLMSAGDEKVEKARKEGAIGFLKKPIHEEELLEAFHLLSAIPQDQLLNQVLLIEDQETQSKHLTQQLVDKGVKVVQAFTGQEALNKLQEQAFDCIILDLHLPDISGFDLLDTIKKKEELQRIPVVINTAMELSKEQLAQIMRYSEAMVLKSTKSNDRLIDEVSLFMNKLRHQSPDNSRKSPREANAEKSLAGKRVLITDDDMRNIFALSTVLQEYQMEIVIANNGREALEKLQAEPSVDLVLMDIMMPEMDGYEAMRAIRKNKKFAKLPMIALTAKAMKTDRQKCIEAGANDYISKPVDIDELLSMMRVWLSHQ